MKYKKEMFIWLQGFIVSLLLVLFLLPGYTDHSGRIETDAVLPTLEPTKTKIEAAILQNKSLSGAGTGLASDVPGVLITTDGLIVYKGGSKGQLLVLIPSLQDEKVVWACKGGSNPDMPAACQ